MITASASGDLTRVCRGKDEPPPEGLDLVLWKVSGSTMEMIFGVGGGNNWKCAFGAMVVTVIRSPSYSILRYVPRSCITAAWTSVLCPRS